LTYADSSLRDPSNEIRLHGLRKRITVKGQNFCLSFGTAATVTVPIHTNKKAFFTVGSNASKSGLIDVLFDMHPKYLLVDEIEHLKHEYQTTLLSLMETGILTQTMHSKVRHMHLKTWVFATSNGTKKLSEPLPSRFRVMYLNEYEFSQFYEIAVKKLLDEGLDKKVADEIAISVWEQLPKLCCFHTWLTF
jgi:Holliday junction resolvasome RuvABC ATP-dependent DNA helicase subunit